MPAAQTVTNLTAIPEARTGSVILRWEAPVNYRDEVTCYEVRFKPAGAENFISPRALPVGTSGYQLIKCTAS